MDEIPLLGGNLTAGVVRVGDTVRRPAAAWTPAVHALLRHLEAKGFAGAPRALGIDGSAREILSFVAGSTAWPWDAFQPLMADDALLRVADLISSYHASVADFEPPPGAAWNPDAPPGDRGIVCHNDLAPWNLVIGPAGELTFIDWDLASPGSRLSDLAYAARTFTPLDPNPNYDPPIVHRLGLLRHAWGLTTEALIEGIVTRVRLDLAGFRARVAAGVEPWATLWETHASTATGIAEFVEANAASWRMDLQASPDP